MIWPFFPLNEMVEGIEFVTDAIRSFSLEQRISLTDIPRRRVPHEYLFTAEQYERARAKMRGRHPFSMDLPDWPLRNKASGNAGATSLSFDNTYPTLGDGDRAIILQSADLYEEIFIESGDASGLVLSSPLEHSYRNAVLAPLIACFSTEGLQVDHSSSPMRPGQAEWLSFEGTDIADDGSFGTYRGEPLLTFDARLGSSSFAEVIAREYDTVDNGIAEPFYDNTVETSAQSLGMAWQVETRQQHWAIRQLIYALKGRQRAFWLPDWNGGITLASGALNGATTLSVRNFGFTDGYESGDIFIRLKNGTVITRQVTGAVEAGTNETLTISPGLPQAIAPSDIRTFSLLFRVRQAEDRVKITHRASPGPKVVMALQEVPIP